jgi:peroxisomal membrane protein 4
MSAIHAILSNPQYHDYLAILKGARNGFVYGVKVRFPHALIMAILFGRGEYVCSRGRLPLSLPCYSPRGADHFPCSSWPTRLKAIFRATKQHATSLCQFVTIYKALLLLQRKLNGGKERTHDTFFAGLFGGYLVFGERNAINEQVRLFSHISTGVRLRIVFFFFG